ncbi:hypothetical protein GIB67_020243 [Kingdonia uniflora]|uniref:Bicarbonate transporter-like transmembrane domain-containing protein n=1 Tax=Kingdonia uniflora TaxID=39325 RepID=A0A7J7P3P8_9MAGN|nr:hypothetical protein GIB67_020243 [Kingdonia uniflora]
MQQTKRASLHVTGLYFFDHSVASQLAQQEEFNLKKPSASHNGILLLGFMVLLCGLIGIPPSNGVLPQSPMHTKSFVVLKRQVVDSKEDGTKCKRMHKTRFINFFCADTDMSEGGNRGMIFEEYRAHFNIWALMKVLPSDFEFIIF